MDPRLVELPEDADAAVSLIANVCEENLAEGNVFGSRYWTAPRKRVPLHDIAKPIACLTETRLTVRRDDGGRTQFVFSGDASDAQLACSLVDFGFRTMAELSRTVLVAEHRTRQAAETARYKAAAEALRGRLADIAALKVCSGLGDPNTAERRQRKRLAAAGEPLPFETT